MDEDSEDEDEDSEEEDEDSLEEGGGIRVLFFGVDASSLVCFSALKWFTVQVTRYSIISI